MEERKHVTAEWARKTAEAVLGEKVQEEVNKCLTAIESAVKANKLSTSIIMYAESLTQMELTRRGFKVKQQDDQRDGSYLLISW